MEKQEREKRIKKKVKELSDICTKLDASKMDLAKDMIEKLAFFSVCMEECQDLILEHGYIETYQNGENQSGAKPSSYVNVHNTFAKNYANLLKQLIQLFQNNENKTSNEMNELGMFLAASKSIKK